MIFNFHIPKTAGTTLATLLQLSHGDRHVQLYFQPPFAFLSDASCRKLKHFYPDALSVSSHNIRFLDPSAFWPGARFMVVLRDPFERFCSAYFHMQRVAPHRVHGLAHPETVEEFLETHSEEHNVMVRFLCGLAPGDELSDAHLGQAMNELQKYHLVGLTEALDATIRRLRSMVPTVRGSLGRENANPEKDAAMTYRNTLSRDTIDAIERANALDSEIYEFARELFRRQGSASES